MINITENILEKINKVLRSAKLFVATLLMIFCFIGVREAFCQISYTDVRSMSATLKANEAKKDGIKKEQKKRMVRIVNGQGYKDAMEIIKECTPEQAEAIDGYMAELLSLSTQTEREDEVDWSGVHFYSPEGRQEEIAKELKKAKQYKSPDENNQCGRRFEKAIEKVSADAAAIAIEIRKRWNENRKELIDADHYNLHKEESKERVDEETQETIAEIEENAKLRECPAIADVKSKHFAGCWTCLVIEKITSAFLHAANKGLKVTQKAGVVLLIVGSGIWLVMWGLKNVSSFTEVQLGNILNDLIKFLFKVALAYWFIFYSQTAISKYFINPIMSVGALVGQQFWDAEIQQYTEDWQYDEFIPDDEVADEDEDEKEDEEQGTSSSGQGTGGNQSTESEEQPTENLPEVEEPKPVEYSGDEAIVQDLQKAFIATLERQWGEIKKSCTSQQAGGQCLNSCRSTGCSDAGHQAYIKDIWKWASGGSALAAYCQASITAAMHKMAEQVGTTDKAKKALNVVKKAVGSCASGYLAAGYKKDEDIVICQNGQQVYNKINVGDTVWLHKSGNTKFGATSEHHATTYLGGGNVLSFNGDSRYTPLCSVYKNLAGKVWCISCLFRDLLKNDPSLKKELNTGRLSTLASSQGSVTFLNYEGGAYANTLSGNTSAFSDGDYSNVIVQIPEVKYTGPTNIMSKSVMNSILGATRAITNTTAGVQVLGDVIMCYSTMENGGAWKEDITNTYWTNVFMYLSGFIILCLGYLLTMTIGYYLVDISFKIGFAVLALPLVMGLWPFDLTKDKLFGVVSIIAKAAATFAFLAIMTAFGMALVSSAFGQGGLDELYDAVDLLSGGYLSPDSKEFEETRSYVARELQFSAAKFILIAFSIWYFFKLIQSTSSDLVNKFFPDAVFGDSSPMHSGATMITSFIKNQAMKPVKLAGDIAANQAGNLAKGALKSGGGLVSSGAKGLAGKVKGAFNKMRGKGGAS